MNYNPTEYFSIHEDTWELDIPRIIANKSTMLWLGKGLLFKSENKDLLNFLNKLKDKDKWNEKLWGFLVICVSLFYKVLVQINSVFKFYHKMSNCCISILNRQCSFFCDIFNC